MVYLEDVVSEFHSSTSVQGFEAFAVFVGLAAVELLRSAGGIMVLNMKSYYFNQIYYLCFAGGGSSFQRRQPS